MTDIITMDWSGIGRLQADLAAAPVRVMNTAVRETDLFGGKVVRSAQGFIPIDTHAAQRSIRHYVTVTDAGSLLFEAGVDPSVAPYGDPVDYGGYLEHGTYKMPARPYMAPAFDLHESNYRRRLGVAAGEAVLG